MEHHVRRVGVGLARSAVPCGGCPGSIARGGRKVHQGECSMRLCLYYDWHRPLYPAALHVRVFFLPFIFFSTVACLPGAFTCISHAQYGVSREFCCFQLTLHAVVVVFCVSFVVLSSMYCVV